jgi:hypothetical protein
MTLHLQIDLLYHSVMMMMMMMMAAAVTAEIDVLEYEYAPVPHSPEQSPGIEPCVLSEKP